MIKYLYLLLLLIMINVHNAAIGAADNANSDTGNFAWMDAAPNNLSSVMSQCISPPKLASIQQNSKTIPLNNSEWTATGAEVSEGKSLQVNWSILGVQPRPQKYRVLYRIDPRFEKPQIFIHKYDYDKKQYISDFHNFKGGILLRYQDTPEMDFPNRVKDFVDYFNFKGRSKIAVKKNDIINITLEKDKSYLNSSASTQQELGSLDEMSIIYTESAIPNNRIIYSSADLFCKDGITSNSPAYNSTCSNQGKYMDVYSNWKTFQGMIASSAFSINTLSILRCSDSDTDKSTNSLCYYDQGRGMQFSIGHKIIKEITEQFVHSPYNDQDFFYYKSDIDGYIEFQTIWDINGMYNGYNQFMRDWSDISTYQQLKADLSSYKSDITMNFLHFGRYLMEIEIGNSLSVVDKSELDQVQLEYIIIEQGAPSDKSKAGTLIDRNYKGNANATGSLFVRVLNPNDRITGTVEVKIANYDGSTWFSDLIYERLIKPMRKQINNLSKILYSGLVHDPAFVNIANIMLTLYIIIYGLLFLAGATQITVQDIVTRVIKISIILTLLSESSWSFFDTYVFNLFTNGMDQLMGSVAGITSKHGNLFGFIDPIFSKYTNSSIWGSLISQLFQLNTMLPFAAIITIYAIIKYLRSVLEVIVSYCLAMVGMAVMLSLAPLFIILILFERTKSMFDNWVSLLFSYMIQPTVLLVFFLLIDQIMGEYIIQTIVTSCWEQVASLKVSLDVGLIPGKAISFSPSFLPEISSYTPQVAPVTSIEDIFLQRKNTYMVVITASLTLFMLSKLAAGLVDYIGEVVRLLTNVEQAKSDSPSSKGSMQDIMSDLGKGAKAATSPATFIKDKIIDQKISHRDKNK